MKIKNRVKQRQFKLSGGLITDYDKPLMPEGSLLVCANFEPSVSGYVRSKGYEAFDGQPLASSIALGAGNDDVAREAQRALIQAVPGSGKVLGVAILKGEIYAFRNKLDGLSAGMYKATASGWEEVVTGVTLNPDGRYRFVVNNFYGNGSTLALYGVDGKNKPFEFDGTVFTQLSHGATGIEPTTIAVHSMHLFLGFDEGVVMHSSTGQPNDFDVVNGAGEIGVGDKVTGLKSGLNTSLIIMKENSVSVLYGSSSLDWKQEEVTNFDDSIGGYPDTIQEFFGRTVYLDSNGVRSMEATTNYGNFSGSSLAPQVASKLRIKPSNAIGSSVVASKDQYRIYVTDEARQTTEAFVFTSMPDSSINVGRQLIPMLISCVNHGEDSVGNELLFYGGDDGFVYKAESGTSFNGNPLTATITTAFTNAGNLTARKRFKKALLIADASADVVFRAKPEFSYGDVDIASHRIIDTEADGGGGIWGFDDWGDFTWGQTVVNFGDIDINGTGNSVSLVIYYSGKYDESFTLNMLSIDYIPRRLER